MYRTSSVNSGKEKLITLILARTGTPRSELAAKTIQELETILDDSLMAQIRAEAHELVPCSVRGRSTRLASL